MNDEWKKFLADNKAEDVDIIVSRIDGKNLKENVADELVETYEPYKHEAPNVIGHPETNKPAYGWVKKIYRKGKNLWMKASILPGLADMIRKGMYKKRSIAWYPPNHPANPTPGKNYLMHVGWLGAVPPAIKGMPDAQLSENIDDVVVVEYLEEKKEKETESMDKDKFIYTQEAHEDILTTKLSEAKTKFEDGNKDNMKTLAEEKKGFEDKIKKLEDEAKVKDTQIKTFTEKTYELEVAKALSDDLKLKIAPANKEKVEAQLLKLRKLSEEDLKDQVEIYKAQPDIIELGENEDAAGEGGEKKTLTEKKVEDGTMSIVDMVELGEAKEGEK
ncbi:hypothetical protein KAR91_76135 [Candidatus Pacearchaeota archaeon]|nr:hypothetical protein [Candidatus Pacearchaeota archaeon]